MDIFLEELKGEDKTIESDRDQHSLQELIARFLEYKRKTVDLKHYEDLVVFFRKLKDTSLSELEEKKILQALCDTIFFNRDGRTHRQCTIKKYRVHINIFLNFLMNDKYLTINRMSRIRYPKTYTQKKGCHRAGGCTQRRSI